jgi:uncharacterized protein (DUF1501 family)
MSSACYHCQQADSTRRDFLRMGALTFLGLNLTEYLRLGSAQALAATDAPVKPGNARACILLWLEGGIGHIDSWDVKGNSSFKPISTNVSGIQIAETLPKIARHMDKLAIIRSMRTQERNHPQATLEFLTGHRPNPALKFPSFGSIVAKELGPRNDMPPYTLVPMPNENDFFSYQDAYKAAWIGSEYDGMVLPDPSKPGFAVPDLSLPKTISAEEIKDGLSLLKLVDRYFREKEHFAEFAKLDAFEEQALRMILSPEVKKAFDLSQESDKTKDRYGRDRVGQAALLARRLVEAGCRFVTVAGYSHGAWDTHANNDKLMRDKLTPVLDRSLSALLEDLAQSGMLESTVVIATGEFGRTPVVNPNRGRDHWPDCWSLVLGGGGIKGGQIVGASDDKGAYVADRPISIGDLYATVYKAMGIDSSKTYMSPIGRPVYIANGFDDMPGTPLKELI